MIKKFHFMDKENIRSDSTPALIVYFDSNYYQYDGPKDNPTLFLHFINKIINPLVNLDSEEEVETFMDHQKEWKEKSKFFSNKLVPLEEAYKARSTKTRVVAFIFDKDEYEDDIKGLRIAGR